MAGGEGGGVSGLVFLYPKFNTCISGWRLYLCSTDLPKNQIADLISLFSSLQLILPFVHDTFNSLDS